jgi:hypothetical protein
MDTDMDVDVSMEVDVDHVPWTMDTEVHYQDGDRV